jgi:putative FmdB family regulatory protein
MPIYEYACTACRHEMEVIQKITDQPLQQCPICHQSSLKKLISKSAFRLSGSGWYETDFKSKKKPESSGSEQSSDSKEKSETAATNTEVKSTTSVS